MSIIQNESDSNDLYSNALTNAPASIEPASIEPASNEPASNALASNGSGEIAKIIKKCNKISPDKAHKFLISYEKILKNHNINELNFDKFDKDLTDEEMEVLLIIYSEQEIAYISSLHETLNEDGITKENIKSICA